MNAPFVRASGRGPAVLCLHSSGASARQWDRLAERLSHRYRVVSADLTGHGQRPGWESGDVPTLRGEAAVLAGLVAGEPGGVHLVGHSYGAAVALKLALAMPRHVRSLTLYEPVLFSLLLEGPMPHPAGDEVLTVGNAIRESLFEGRADEAAERFVDYWSGPGTYARMPAEARAVVVSRMRPVMLNFDALFEDTTSVAHVARLALPTLLLNGTESPASSRAVTQRLALALPYAWRHEMEGLGHMGPMTHPQIVNEAIEAFLDSAKVQDLLAVAA